MAENLLVVNIPYVVIVCFSLVFVIVIVVVVVVIVMTQCVGNGMRRFGSRVLDLILHTSSPGFTGGKHARLHICNNNISLHTSSFPSS